MSRLEEVCDEYRRLRPNGPVSRDVRFSAMIEAQYSVRLRRTNGASKHDACGSYHKLCRVHTSAKNRIRRGHGCWCHSHQNQLVVLAYDDWGEGPQCIMCGAPKEDHQPIVLI